MRESIECAHVEACHGRRDTVEARELRTLHKGHVHLWGTREWRRGEHMHADGRAVASEDVLRRARTSSSAGTTIASGVSSLWRASCSAGSSPSHLHAPTRAA